MCNDSLITYRYRYRSNLQLEGVLQLLLSVPENPRSILYYIQQLEILIEALPKGEQHRLLPSILEAKLNIQLCEVDQVISVKKNATLRRKLDNLLQMVNVLMGAASNLIIENYFSHTVDRYGLIQTTQLPNI